MTHFSQLMPIIPDVNENYQKEKVMVAFDHMRLNLSQFEYAYKFVPILETVFNDARLDT